MGTSVILRSLKKAAPLLVHVAFLIGFFWLLFAIIGVQSFKSSLRRTCVWSDTDGSSYIQTFQFCGGYINGTTSLPMPWLKSDAITYASSYPKGYLCPQGSKCVEGINPYNDTVSFDNVLQALQLVFVIMSANTFSDLLYYTTESDYLAAALFFAFGIVIMTFWLMNLLVAVITSSFQVIREESKASAFTIDQQPILVDDIEEPKLVSSLKRAYDKTAWLWISVIAFSLVVQCLRSADMSSSRKAFITDSELVVTLILLLEILLRFVVDWRNFHTNKRNWVDLGLAVITAVIQIPGIRDSGQPYAWLTVFQIIRIYRVVVAVPMTRKLIGTVFRNITGLLNLIVFVFLLTFLVAIFAVQNFRGEINPVDSQENPIRITFLNIYNSFIGMYQVLSSENWTILMYNATQYSQSKTTSWMAATFFILWFILANFIVLNMFIAVIQESFDVTEDEKRLEQVKAFLQRKELGGSSHGNLSLSTIFKLGMNFQRHKDPLDYGPATTDMLLKDAVVREFLDERLESHEITHTNGPVASVSSAGQVRPGVLSLLWSKAVSILHNREPNPFHSRLQFSRAYKDLDPRTMASEVVSATDQKKRAQREYLRKHPRYNVSLFLFSPAHPIRRFCQRIVGPGRGSTRIEGVDPIRSVWYSFSAFIYATIVAMVLLACITTPLYQRNHFEDPGRKEGARGWFVWTDMGFAAVFTIEAVIKVIADGFFWTPNACFRSSWGLIDGLVLVTLWINVVTSLHRDGGVSRAIGAFKALRALRLLNVSDSARDTFHSVIILGGWKVLSAAFVSLSLLVPFAIYGLNLFYGLMLQCNDSSGSITNLSTDCVGEYNSSPYKWNVYAPREYSNPYYNFDDFGNSLFILFQIVSQEGWTDVMWQAMSSPGRGLQQIPYASEGNAVFFIVFNLLGAVFVLTLFVSVFMRNYTEQTGVAFLTADQRSWLELRKLLRQISPSKRPSDKPDQSWRTWCYRIAVKKHGKWQKTVTTVLCLHLVLLVLEWYPEPKWWEVTRDCLFLGFTGFYIANIAIRILGLTWKRFRRSSWDLYSILAVPGALITTILALTYRDNAAYAQVHKMLLVAIALLLIPRNNQLDQLFKTAAASLTTIGNLLATWFVLFLVFAIALTQTFGLTRFGQNENGNLNFRTVPKALILLFRMSCGEGWNTIMEDFATITPPNCVVDEDFYNSDCGSAPWARFLFIAWNIVSMYIFVSMFVSLIFESFSYVYQRSSFSISRHEIRRFKEAWATQDREGTGFISKEAFPDLLRELSGVFDMRIYKGEHSVGSILEACRVETQGPASPGRVVHGVDLDKLSERISTINVAKIREQRRKLDHFCQEVVVSADQDRGINFTSCLMILAHYNVISDSKSLRLEEFLRRKARLQRVDEEVRRRVVAGFLDTCYWSSFRRHNLELRHSARMVAVPSFPVPEIYIDDQNAQTPAAEAFPAPAPGLSPMDAPRLPEAGASAALADYPGRRHRADSRGSSPARSDRSNNGSPRLVPRRPSLSDGGGERWGHDGSVSLMDGGSLGGRSRAGSSAVDRQNVLDVFDNSAWGESIRRSFTLSRRGTRGRAGGGEVRGLV
ncbi:calcium channel subunit cch1 [Lasallia pustulata]|uniref:Calcium-channel protein CCH1 n=1 Tax=Lasallia pustulata TaxID=136370 RepID=A0A1W5D398_9LECA|nr:calcium channel subunit cch1 [Lasallia pustulata]